tara:strand:+ start:307 stop:531 length:225 start_codon:yes stop_codon:yes gene_type:complete
VSGVKLKPAQQKGIIMCRRPGLPMQKIFVQHWRWLEAQGESYKQQASSCKRQALQLTRQNYNVIVSYKLKERKV